MKVQRIRVKLSNIICVGPSVIQIRQLLTWTTRDIIPELPLKFTFVGPEGHDAYLTMTNVNIVERLGPDESPDYKITGKCDQDVLQILSPGGSGDKRIDRIELIYNPETKKGVLTSMVIQLKL